MKKTATKNEYKCTYEGCSKVCKSKQGLLSHETVHLRTSTPREKLERVENVEFNIQTDEQAKEICAHLAQLESTTGWIYLKKMLHESMRVIEKQIITKISIDDGRTLTEDEVDILRKSYLAYEELINKPAQLIENITKGNRPTMPQYDPYARVLTKDKENYSGVLEMDESDE